METIQSLVKVFQSRKMSALLLIGFSSGLPFLLTSRTLQAWMTVEGIKLSTIGLFSLVALPYSLKFLWAPVLDRFIPPFLGRRRGWLLITQLALLVGIAAMSLHNPQQSLQFIAINAIVIAFFSATQDIAADAYRTDVLDKPELGAGAAIFVTGYRIALLITGAIAFFLADRMPWQNVYLLLSLLIGIGMVAAFFAPEPEQQAVPPLTLSEAVVQPLLDFFGRLGRLRGSLILGFIVLYKFGDSLLNNMAIPFLLQTGFTQTDIGAIQGGMGILATIVGTLVGGAIFSRIGVNRSLWIFGGLQAFSNVAYLVLAQVGQNYPFMVVAINVENFCTGLGNAAFLAFLMSLCNQRFSATQFALLSSLMAVSRDILVARAGALAEATGWTGFFFITILAAIPGLLLLPVFAPWNEQTVSEKG
ncbi:AmpG family muropeptide MFS transporter [Myxacorys almedinensis]|uniref:MFS transporter n=1 Tax=Myxacorys almedinensis A TaxID=2690445 RepID=A0A8J7YXJ5_9CYAN|nr:MFS transporter [Myxacorys almedinensis A]